MSWLILQRVPTTFLVIGSAYVLAILIAVPLGITSAVRQYSWYDQIVTTFSFIGFSLPSFFTGLLLIILFSVRLGWLPMIYDQNTSDPVQMIKQMIKGHPTESLPRQARESQGSWMIKAHPTENRMARQAA